MTDLVQFTDKMQNVKCVVVGDGMTGKTCLLITYTTNTFPNDVVPTVYDHYDTSILIDGEPVRLNINDTAGQETYDRVRQLHYPNANVIIITFSIMERQSFENVSLKWEPEVKHFCPDAPIVLVGTKSDLRDDDSSGNRSPITAAEGSKLAKKIGARKYMECSARTHSGVNEVFKEATRLALETRPKRKRKRCSLL